MNRSVFYFTVTGSGPFPMDCLRRNEAWPANCDSVGNIMPSTTGREPRRDVRLGSISRGGPIEGLWTSYGWTVSMARWADA